MERQGDETHLKTDEARAASTPNIVRWVLGISLFAAIALLSIIWITGAATQSGEDEISVSEQMKDREDLEATDSIVSENADEFETAPAVDREPGAPPVVENE